MVIKTLAFFVSTSFNNASFKMVCKVLYEEKGQSNFIKHSWRRQTPGANEHTSLDEPWWGHFSGLGLSCCAWWQNSKSVTEHRNTSFTVPEGHYVEGKTRTYFHGDTQMCLLLSCSLNWRLHLHFFFFFLHTTGVLVLIRCSSFSCIVKSNVKHHWPPAYLIHPSNIWSSQRKHNATQPGSSPGCNSSPDCSLPRPVPMEGHQPGSHFICVCKQ